MAKLNIQNSFGIAPNEILNDNSISLSAKGLYVFMQSKPENWDFSLRGIASQNSNGISAVTSAVDELILKGWLGREKHHGIKGEIYYEYTLFGKPNLGNLNTENLNNSNKDLSKKDEVSPPSKIEIPFTYLDYQQQTKNKTLQECAHEYFYTARWRQAVELLCMNLKLTENGLKYLALDFNKHRALQGKIEQNINEWGKHFGNWAKNPKRIEAAQSKQGNGLSAELNKEIFGV